MYQLVSAVRLAMGNTRDPCRTRRIDFNKWPYETWTSYSCHFTNCAPSSFNMRGHFKDNLGMRWPLIPCQNLSGLTTPLRYRQQRA